MGTRAGEAYRRGRKEDERAERNLGEKAKRRFVAMPNETVFSRMQAHANIVEGHTKKSEKKGGVLGAFREAGLLTE